MHLVHIERLEIQFISRGSLYISAVAKLPKTAPNIPAIASKKNLSRNKSAIRKIKCYIAVMTDANTENNQQQTESAASPQEVLSNLQGFGDINLRMKVVLGSIKMPIAHYLKITRGSIVELNKSKNDNLDIIVNDHKVAEAEILLSADTIKIAVEVVKVHKPKKY